MKKIGFVGSLLAVVLVLGLVAWDMPQVARFTSEVIMDVGSVLNLNSTWKIDGTEVTATAAQLNAAGGGTTATITASLVTNVNGVVSVSNLNLKGSAVIPSLAATTITNVNGFIAASNANFKGSVTVSNLAVQSSISAETMSASKAASMVITVLVADATSQVISQRWGISGGVVTGMVVLP